MIQSVLWLEGVAACVLLVLWGVAHAQQAVRRRSLARAVAVLTVLFTLGVIGLQLLATGFLYSRGIEKHLLGGAIAFAAVVVVSVSVFLWRGWRKTDERRAIEAWPVARLGIGALACAALYLTTLMTTDTSVQLQLANVRLEAGALALSAAPPRPIERENAALVYTRVFERIEAQETSELHKAFQKNLGKTDEPGYQPHSTVKEYIARHRSTLELLRKAAAMPACAFDRAYSAPSMSMRLPELGKLRHCARMLVVEARIRAAEGDTKGALENIRAVQRMAEHLSYEPILISALVSVACETQAFQTLEAILRSQTLSSADLAAWTGDDLFSYRRVYTRAMRGERAFGMTAFAEVSGTHGANWAQLTGDDGGPMKGFMIYAGLPYWRVYLMNSDLKGYTDVMERMEDLSSKPYAEAKAELTRMNRDPAAYGGILTRMIAPALTSAHRTFHVAEARVRLSCLARAVCAYRAKHNALPAELAALTPEFIDEIPLDPFDNQPLRMTVHAKGVTLYSVGDNLADDHGTPPVGNDQNDNDVVFRIGEVPDTKAVTAKPPLPGPPEPSKSGF